MPITQYSTSKDLHTPRPPLPDQKRHQKRQSAKPSYDVHLQRAIICQRDPDGILLRRAEGTDVGSRVGDPLQTFHADDRAQSGVDVVVEDGGADGQT
jgi:hypothetical protein